MITELPPVRRFCANVTANVYRRVNALAVAIDTNDAARTAADTGPLPGFGVPVAAPVIDNGLVALTTVDNLNNKTGA